MHESRRASARLRRKAMVTSIATLVLLVGVAADESSSLHRVDAAFDGLQRYFYTSPGFWKSCGQTGGLGGASTNFGCVCETGTPFCKNCYRWWMAITLQSLMGLDSAAGGGGHVSANFTRMTLDTFLQRSPYSSRVKSAARSHSNRLPFCSDARTCDARCAHRLCLRGRT